MLPENIARITDTLALAVGVPVIAYLLYTAARRARQVRERIRQVQEELSRSPLPPLAQLGQLMEEQAQHDKPAPPRRKPHG